MVINEVCVCVFSIKYRYNDILLKILTQLAYRANGNKLWYIGQ